MNAKIKYFVIPVILLVSASALAAAPDYPNVPYDTDSTSQKLDLYLPTGFTAPYPLIIYVHGGAWWGGDKSGVPNVEQFLSRGYAMAGINYRLSTEAYFPAQIHDVKGAIRFLRANADLYNIDPNNFAAMGYSAGGHLVALLATSGNIEYLEGNVGGNINYSSQVQAAGDISGPTDFFPTASQTSESQNAPIYDDPISQLFGAEISDILEHWSDPDYAVYVERIYHSNPINFIDPNDPPTLIRHGDMDSIVPIQQAQIFYDALDANNIDVAFDIIEGGGHWGNWPMQGVYHFFDIYLKHPAKSDINTDSTTDLKDLALLTDNWLNNNCPMNYFCNFTDLNRDKTVNFHDYIIIANNWLNNYNIKTE